MLYIIIGSVAAALVLGGAIALVVIKSKRGKSEPAPRAEQEVAAGQVAEDKPEEVAETFEEKAEEEPAQTAKDSAEDKSAEISQDGAEEAIKEVEEEKPTAEEEEGNEEEDEAEDNEGDEVGELAMVEENGKVRYIIIKYSKSFQAKLIQSDGETKNYYSRIKNCLLSYGGVKSRISWKWEAFRIGRKTVAKLRMRGKTLSVALALDPARYEDTKYIVESLAEVKSYAETPCLYKIKNDRRLKYCAELIDVVMAENGLTAGLAMQDEDYAAQFPFETTEALIERKLIKVLTDGEAQSGTQFMPAQVRRSVTVQEADNLMGDEVAELLVEKAGGVSDRTRTGIVNIDTLSRYFTDGETVTLEEVKKRVPNFSNKVTYLKVLGRGTLDKKLTVEADNFSLQAVKMIVITGGKAVKK